MGRLPRVRLVFRIDDMRDTSVPAFATWAALVSLLPGRAGGVILVGADSRGFDSGPKPFGELGWTRRVHQVCAEPDGEVAWRFLDSKRPGDVAVFSRGQPVLYERGATTDIKYPEGHFGAL